MWVLFFHLLLFFKFLKGEGFFLDEVFFFGKGEGGMGLFIYYFFVNFFIIYILLSYFLPLKGGGWHGFYFSPFLLFFVLCVKLLLPFFPLSCWGEGVWVFFHFIIIIFKKKISGTFFTF
jgi:hypothetical protein